MFSSSNPSFTIKFHKRLLISFLKDHDLSLHVFLSLSLSHFVSLSLSPSRSLTLLRRTQGLTVTLGSFMTFAGVLAYKYYFFKVREGKGRVA